MKKLTTYIIAVMLLTTLWPVNTFAAAEEQPLSTAELQTMQQAESKAIQTEGSGQPVEGESSLQVRTEQDTQDADASQQAQLPNLTHDSQAQDLSQKDVSAEVPSEGSPARESTKEKAVQAATAVTTKVTGLATSRRWSATATAPVTDIITISPAKRRNVRLQMYSIASKKWITKKTFSTKSDGTYKLKIAYPSDWKKANLSRWRLSISSVSGAKAYISPTIQFATRNRKALNLNAKSAILVEKNSGQIFYGKDMDKRRANASTTKIMTSILALEKKPLTSTVKISKNAVNTPWQTLKYKTNDTAAMRDILHAVLLLSDNGSATALAEHVSGSRTAFAKLMNQKAKQLGCKNTHFVNPHGLDTKNHYSSAHDLSIIGRYAMKNKTFSGIVRKKQYTFTTKKYRKRYTVRTTNELLGSMKGIVGIKTGTETNSGYCFVGAYQHKGKTYISVVLGCKNNAKRWEDTKKLIGYLKTYV